MKHKLKSDRPREWSWTIHPDAWNSVLLPQMEHLHVLTHIDNRDGMCLDPDMDVLDGFAPYRNREDLCVSWEETGMEKLTEQGMTSPPCWGLLIMGDELG